MAGIQSLVMLKRRISLALRSDAERRFRGSFATHAEAMAAVPKGRAAGYDNSESAEIAFDLMCRVELWDYPVLFWLDRLVRNAPSLIDAGGHMGTKYRAFRGLLPLRSDFDWLVYDVPAVVRAGRKQAEADRLTALQFFDRLQDVPETDVMLASGLLQYLDVSFDQFVGAMRRRPRHIVLNKVATRDGETLVMLERFPASEVPYVVHNRLEFEASLGSLGYAIRDQWTIPPLSPMLGSRGQITSRGYYAVLEQG